MKTAFCFRGIHYATYHPTDNFRIVDYRFYESNIKKALLRYLNADVYFSTYKSEIDREMLRDYKPVDGIFHRYKPYEKTEIAQCRHYLSLIELIEKSDRKYDNIIFTRFDIMFFKTLPNANVNWNKVNFVYGTPGPDDNFIVVPYPLLNLFKNAITKVINNKELTHALACHIPEEFVHYMFENKGHAVGICSYFKLRFDTMTVKQADEMGVDEELRDTMIILQNDPQSLINFQKSVTY